MELFAQIELGFDALSVPLQVAILMASAVATGILVNMGIFMALLRLGRHVSPFRLFDGLLLSRVRNPLFVLVPLILLGMISPLLHRRLKRRGEIIVGNIEYLILVFGLAWLTINLVTFLADWVTRRFSFENEDNLRARKVATQTGILKRIVHIGVFLIAVAVMLLRFDTFRSLGTGLLASAGILSVVVGIAAQRTLGNLLAGFQIALTQPIRLDDVVIVEGEWGWIEEITLTFVVVRIWDLRRLVVPISHFIEKPFQNWTRTSADILGTVFLYVDYTVPVVEVREVLNEMVEKHPLWDGKVCRLHVTELSDRTVELRVLVSASSSPKAFELRCDLREKLIAYLSEHYPQSLPVLRTALQSDYVQNQEERSSQDPSNENKQHTPNQIHGLLAPESRRSRFPKHPA